METPQKPRGWLSSLTGLVSGSRSTAQYEPSASANGIDATAKPKNSARLINGDGSRRMPLQFARRNDSDSTHTRFSGTFSAPTVASPPESPVQRASSTQMAQRKIHDRVQGPSSRLGSSASASSLPVGASGSYGKNAVYGYGGSLRAGNTATPRKTNFSSATTPRNMFRDTMTRDAPSFTFTPRVPPNTLRGSFPAVTPGRSLRVPGVELSARGLAKTTSSDLFALKIPEPDAKLSGEAVANMVPDDLKTGGKSVYASEYLAHLCPPDFSEEQRNQFFCILDLRRLKYAADDVFLKKDWRLNILNFAKEYEKNRSLIMLRYGLYEFKTVKVSKDIFQKWKAANNIPDHDDEDDDVVTLPATSTATAVSATPKGNGVSRPNGTEGILRAGKRKAQDNIDPAAATASPAANKRSRVLDGSRTDRATESSTPSAALGKSKRKVSHADNADQLQRAKQQKPVETSSSVAAPSATKSFLERVANSPAKEATASSSASASAPAHSKPALTKSSTTSSLFSKPSTNGNSLARSVLEGGLKTSATQGANIFSYLSDASSAKGSGNDNADADGEDTDESDGQDQEESEAKPVASTAASATSIFATASTGASATSAPSLFSVKPAASTPSLFGQGASSNNPAEASEATPSGRSLFDRINKGSDGQPLRKFGSDSTTSSAASASIFGIKPTSEKASPEKETAPFNANKTWTPDTPIKFGAASTNNTSTSPTKPVPAASLFGAASSAASSTPSLFSTAPKDNAAASSALKFGSAATEAAPSFTTNKTADSVAPAAALSPAPSLFSSKPAEAAPVTTAPSLFGQSSSVAAPVTSAPSLFGQSSTTAPAKPAASLFGATASTQPATSTPASIFGTPASAATATAPAVSASSALQSQTLFGNATATAESQTQKKRSADVEPVASGASIFGNGAKLDGSSTAEPSFKKPLFGSANTASQTPASSLFGSAATNGSNGVSAGESKPLFGSNGLSNGSSFTAKQPESQMSSLFGGSNTGAATPASSATTPALFSFGGGSTSNGITAAPSTTPTTSFSFGNSSMTQPANTPTVPAAAPMFSFGSSAVTQPATTATTGPSFGSVTDTGSASSSFTFNFGGGASQPFRNPFASGESAATPVAPSLSFGNSQATTQPASSPSLFQFGGGANTTTTPAPSLFSFGGNSQPPSAPTGGSAGGVFGNTSSSMMNSAASSIPTFSFSAGGASSGIFGDQKPTADGSMFNLGPAVGGTTTGTNTPLTNLGGASSLATTPATGTPEPGANQDNTDHDGHQADGDAPKQEQISLTDGGPGEEDEDVVHEIRAKALRLVTADDESGRDSPAGKEKKSPWKTEGVGPLRVLKHKKTGAVRLLLRAEPRGSVALNRALLADFSYKPEPNAKYVKLTTANESGQGLETWMLQVKTKEAAQKLAEVLEENKAANKK